MKGQKGALDEGGVRSPLLIRWPGRIPAGTRISQIAGAIDLLPTLADLAGAPLASEKPLDGVSLKPLLLETNADWPVRMLFNFWNGRISVRTQSHRLDPAGRLYDITRDPGQHRDIAAQNQELADRLAKAANEMQQEFREELGKDDRPFTVGYSTTTPLPARDGVPHGGVQRSERAPNCSYFTNWTSPEDRITWDIQPREPGRYEAIVYYTCPAGDVGSTVELSLGDAKTKAKVSEPHDPPLRGAENDRVPRRGESYVKDFRPLSLGTIELAGRGQLTLRALEIPGKQVMDVRYLMLTRVE
jgi:hypothetical protein